MHSLELTCGGCKSEESAPEYYCSGADRFLYFRCKTMFDSSTLTWDVSPLLNKPVALGGLSRPDNIIRHEGITVVVDTVDFTEGHNQIISYLWLDLGLLNSDVTVSCSNGSSEIMKTLKRLGRVLLHKHNYDCICRAI